LALAGPIADCRRCGRLVRWREDVALAPPPRHAGQTYWARAVPGTGDPAARLLVLGLAPGAHGANRTGRPFSGDGAGGILFAAMQRHGFASGDQLRGVWLTNAVKCAPPANRPTPQERDTCAAWLDREAAALRPRVVVALGVFSWDVAVRRWAAGVHPRPPFAHLAEAAAGAVTILGSYHPSRQNTNTGRLTLDGLAEVFARARVLLSADDVAHVTTAAGDALAVEVLQQR
jgi:uracil-DNA glycosylase